MQVVNDVRQFMRAFERNISTLDKRESVKRLHKFLEETEAKLMATPSYAAENEVFKENGREGLEKFVTIRLYHILFTRLGDEVEDTRVQRHIASLQWIKFKHLGVDDVQEDMFELAMEQLRQMDSYKSPRDKLIVIMNTCRIVQRVCQQQVNRQFSADDFLPLLIFVLIKANPPHLHSNTEFITEVRHPSRLRGEEAYFFTTLSSAIAWVSNASFTNCKLKDVTEEEYAKNCEEQLEIWDATNPESPTGGDGERRELSPPRILTDSDRDMAIDSMKILLSRVTYQFENKNHADLRVSEVGLLLDEYQLMCQHLRRMEALIGTTLAPPPADQ